jgi:hypothetical protein
MTKLEELKAAWEAAAYDACVAAKGVTEYADAADAAEIADASAAAWDAADAAWVAYREELEKQENSHE